MINDMISMRVVINGLAITAGSSLHFFAINGRTAPISFAKINVMQSESEIVRAVMNVAPAVFNSKPSINIILPKQMTPKLNPIIIPTQSSFQMTFGVSLNSTSFRAIPRIIVALACPPAFPPVPIIIGIQEVKIIPYIPFDKRASFLLITSPVKVALKSKKISQGIRFNQSVNGFVFKYGFSLEQHRQFL